MKTHFVMMASYNAWANARLFRMAGALADELYRQEVGAYFKSLHGTLNHLLVADRIWMRRLTGSGDHPDKLNAKIFDDLSSLHAARVEEDSRIIGFVQGLAEPRPSRNFWTIECSMARLNGSVGGKYSPISSITRRIIADRPMRFSRC